MYFSKSRYCEFCQCQKAAWLRKYKPEEFVQDNSVEARLETGNEVGDLAMGLFGEFVEVTARKADGKLDLDKMKELTRQYIQEGRNVICEASFDFNGLYCAVDILLKTPDGYAIYEVKSATHAKYVNIQDVTYQKYVLEKCGIKVTGTYLVTINSDYVFDGELDLHKLFKITDLSGFVPDEMEFIEPNLASAEKILSSDTEPNTDLGEYCKNPYTCGFFGYCGKHLPTPSVFDIYNLPFKTKINLYRKGVISFEEVLKDGYVNDPLRLRQIDFALNDRGTHINKERIRQFLGKLTYPLYFLDFETMQTVIPQYVGTKPYQQVTFQYSLHYIENDGGELKHKEFLGDPETDPRRALAEQLIADIPDNACVLAYNKAFECTRIGELAKAYPDLATKLLKIKDNIKDLLDPFRAGYYYNRAMGGSFSIKKVLPAIFPNDPDLDYHNLDGVQNGAEAMFIFPQMKNMLPEEREKTRQSLLKYCGLDTYAMVKIWQKLNETIQS